MRFFTVTALVAVAESQSEPLRSTGSASAMLGNIVQAVVETEGVFFGGISLEETMDTAVEPQAEDYMAAGRRMVATPMGPIPAPTMEELLEGAASSTGKTAEERSVGDTTLRLVAENISPPPPSLGGHP